MKGFVINRGCSREGSPNSGVWLPLLLLSAMMVNVAGAPVYPLKQSASGRFLVDQSNTPCMIVGDSPQALVVNISEADAAEYFTNRNARGFNSLWIDLLCTTYTGGRTNGSTIDGTLPFTGTISGTGYYDLSTTNEAYFAHVDRILNLAAQQGLQVMLDPIETGGWLTTMLANGPANCRAYGQYLGDRYKNVPNIIWFHGNDYQGWQDPNNDAVVTAVALGIKDRDTNHIHTIELNYQVSSSLDDPNWAPIIGLNAAYTYFPTYAEVLHAYNQSSSMPVFMVEANYEFEDLLQNLGTLTPQILRLQEYWTMLSGAGGQLYGNHYTWQFASGWQTNLDTPGAIQMGYLKTLFGSRAWYNLIPDRNHTVLTAGYGTFATNGPVNANDYATAARTADGALVMAYMPTLRTFTVDMSQLSGSATARWYDPASGDYVQISGSPLTNSGTRTFTPPGNNIGGGSDWVLVLETNPPAGPLDPSFPSFVQQNYATPQTPQTQVSASYTTPQIAGNANIVAIGWIDGTASISTVVDSTGNTYQAAVPAQRGTGISQAIYYASNIKGGSNTVTVTFNQPASYVDLRVVEYSGLSPVNPFDAGASAAGNSSAPNSGPVTIQGPNELIFGAGVTSNLYTAAGAGFTLRVITSPTGDIAEDELAASPGTYKATATLNGSGAWLMQAAAFKPAATIPDAPQLRIFLTGFTLQQCSTLASTNWTTATNAVQMARNQYQAAVSPLAAHQYFRLESPYGAAPPALHISITASNAAAVTWPVTGVVAWPASATGFSLQHNSNLGTTNWVGVTNAAWTVGSERWVFVSPLAGQQFYRLRLFIPPATPLLQIALTSTNTAVVVWTTNLPGFTLQQNSDLTTTNWVNATNVSQVVGNENQVTISPLVGQRFYRLKHP